MNEPTRIEKDSMGEVVVPAAALWGAQTQRSLEHFNISTERMPQPLLMALARVKRACAQVNAELGLLDATTAAAISQAAGEVLAAVQSERMRLWRDEVSQRINWELFDRGVEAFSWAALEEVGRAAQNRDLLSSASQGAATKQFLDEKTFRPGLSSADRFVADDMKAIRSPKGREEGKA